jgi:hypothetical protein
LYDFVGRLACKVYERIKREAAARKIQKHIRRYAARTAYKKLHISALLLQTGLRAMVARKEFRFRKRTKAATIIQVTPLMICLLFINSLLSGVPTINYITLYLDDKCRPDGTVIKLLPTTRGCREVQLSHKQDGGVELLGES